MRNRAHSDSKLNVGMSIDLDILEKQRKSLRRNNSSDLLNEPAQQAKYVEPTTGKGAETTGQSSLLVQEKQAEASPAQVSGTHRTSSVSETDQSSNIRDKNKEKIVRNRAHSDSKLNVGMSIDLDILEKQRKSLRRNNSSDLLNEPAQQAKYVEPTTGKGAETTGQSSLLVQEKQAEASPAQVSGIPRTSSVSETDQSDSELNPEILQNREKI